MKELAICLVCDTVLRHENADCNCTRIAELEAEVKEQAEAIKAFQIVRVIDLNELADTRGRMVLLRDERDELRAEVERLSLMVAAKGVPYMWPAAQIILEKENTDLRAQLAAVREWRREVVHPIEPYGWRELDAILQPDRGKGEG